MSYLAGPAPSAPWSHRATLWSEGEGRPSLPVGISPKISSPSPLLSRVLILLTSLSIRGSHWRSPKSNEPWGYLTSLVFLNLWNTNNNNTYHPGCCENWMNVYNASNIAWPTIQANKCWPLSVSLILHICVCTPFSHHSLSTCQPSAHMTAGPPQKHLHFQVPPSPRNLAAGWQDYCH